MDTNEGISGEESSNPPLKVAQIVGSIQKLGKSIEIKGYDQIIRSEVRN